MTETPASELESQPKKGRLRQGGRRGKQARSRSSHEMCGPYIDRKSICVRAPTWTRKPSWMYSVRWC